MRVTAGGVPSNAVDLYNSASGTWSTAQLSVARNALAATSVGNVAIIAAGSTAGDCSFVLFVKSLLFALMSVALGDAATVACLMHAACCLLRLRCKRLPSHGDHCRWWSFQCCGLVQQCIGLMVDCSAQCGAFFACGDICWERGLLRMGSKR